MAVGIGSGSEAETGIAARYVGDAGIENDSEVIFAEHFEEATIPEFTGKWEQCQHKETMSWSNDVPAGSAGRQSLLITAIGGQVWGGDFYRRFPDQEMVYVRYYVKFDAGCAGFHHGPMWIGGHYPSTSFPWPRAGDMPGDDHFSQATEPLGNEWRWDFYNYYPEMRGAGPGKYWGNLFVSDKTWSADRDQWICVEQMLKLNNPASESNGEQAMWINGQEREKDGQIISRFGKGFPRGSKPGGIFRPDPAGEPYGGIRWRLRMEQKINYLWPQVFLDTAPAGVVSKVWYDHMIVAKSYIGPIQATAPKKAAKTVAAKTPLPTPTAAPPVNEIDPKPHRDAIILALQDPKFKKTDTVEMTLLGDKEIVSVSDANSAGIRVSFDGNEMPIKWRDVSDIDLISMAMTYASTDAQTIYEAAALAAASKVGASIQRGAVDLLWTLDVEKGKALKEFLSNR
jgi:hypothetical protein